jgi:hypothetical protein
MMQRSDVVAMLATYGNRQPELVPESIDSLELAWLIHQIEQRYGVLDVDDDMLERMSTVTGVVDVLNDLKVGSPDALRTGRGLNAARPQGARLGGRDRCCRPQRVWSWARCVACGGTVWPTYVCARPAV